MSTDAGHQRGPRLLTQLTLRCSRRALAKAAPRRVSSKTHDICYDALPPSTCILWRKLTDALAYGHIMIPGLIVPVVDSTLKP